MDQRKRTVIGVIWLLVAGLMAISIEGGVPSDWADGVRVFVMVLSLLLAGLYIFDPKGIVSQKYNF